MPMDAQAIREYRNRWQKVAAFEAEEQRNASSTTRWQQLNAIFLMSLSLGVPTERDNDEELAAHRHWNRLRDRYLAER